MPRARSGPARHKRIKKIRARAKGFYAGKKNTRQAKEAVNRADRYAFFGRRQKKRDYRSMWIVRIHAAANQNGISYSRFMNGLKKAGVQLNRKALAELAVSEPKAFAELVETAKGAVGAAK